MCIFLPRLSEESGYTANKNGNIGTIQYHRALRMHKSQRSPEILTGKQTQVFWGLVYSSLWNNISFLMNSFFFQNSNGFGCFFKLQTLPNFFWQVYLHPFSFQVQVLLSLFHIKIRCAYKNTYMKRRIVCIKPFFLLLMTIGPEFPTEYKQSAGYECQLSFFKEKKRKEYLAVLQAKFLFDRRAGCTEIQGLTWMHFNRSYTV